MADQQQKKPGAKDISDLKARLGLKQGSAPAAGAARPAAPAPLGVVPPRSGPSSVAPIGGVGRPPIPGVAPGSVPPGVAAPAAPAPAVPQAPEHDPFAAMKPTGGKMFDLRMVDDGKPVENVQERGGKGLVLVVVVVGVIAFIVGGWFGIIAIGRKQYNSANMAAKSIKVELDTMQKTLTQIGTAVAMSQQRAQQARKDVLSYDPKLITDLEAVKLDPRPDTAKIFRVNYALLEDMVIDNLFNYYYDSIALYGEVERHIRKSTADAESLKAFVEKQSSQEVQKNYGVVFDTSGKLTVANLVEVGEQVCKGGGKDCAAVDLVGFKVRANTGSSWYDRKISSKSDSDRVVPIKATPLMDAVMSGSPDQVRMEAYKQRIANIRGIVGRLTQAQKELFEGVTKASSRSDLFTLF